MTYNMYVCIVCTKWIIEELPLLKTDLAEYTNRYNRVEFGNFKPFDFKHFINLTLNYVEML